MSKWTLTRVSEMADIVSGGTPKTEIAEYWNGDIPCLSAKDFSGNSKRIHSSEKVLLNWFCFDFLFLLVHIILTYTVTYDFSQPRDIGMVAEDPASYGKKE